VANNQFNMYKKVTIVVGKETDKFTWNLSDSKVMTVKNTLLLPGDVLVYDNLNIKKNGVIINRKSNIEMPKFSPGFNNFTFNQNVKKVMFDLRFYKK
ncbi:MAG: phage tail family protein, partial [Staphylococcus warneri]|nr:phage tail family protein [Staphylococcus warneri]